MDKNLFFPKNVEKWLKILKINKKRQSIEKTPGKTLLNFSTRFSAK